MYVNCVDCIPITLIYSPRRPESLLDSLRKAVLSSKKERKKATYMAETFLTLMADYDTASQFRMDEWYGAIQRNWDAVS